MLMEMILKKDSQIINKINYGKQLQNWQMKINVGNLQCEKGCAKIYQNTIWRM